MAYAPPTGQPPYQQPPPQQQGGRRGLLWVGIGCGVLVVVFLLIAVIGGVVFLVVRSGDDQKTTDSAPATQTFTAESFTLEYPAEWSEVPKDGMEGNSGETLQIAPPDKTSDIVVYRYQPNGSPSVATECKAQSNFLTMSFDGDEKPTEEATDDVDGREGYHYAMSGTASSLDEEHAGETMREDLWCMDDGENIVQLAVTTYGSEELGPEAGQILDSWSWTSHD